MTAPTRISIVSFREVIPDNIRTIFKLEVAESQRAFVAPNEISIAQAYFAREEAWFRAIYADETAVGFVMLSDKPRKPAYYLWRFMIAEQYQGMGFGRQAIDLLVAHVKTRPQATELLVSYQPEGEGHPGPFYEKLGFVETGEVEDGENVARMDLVYAEGESPAPAIGKQLTHVVLIKFLDNHPEIVEQTAVKLRSLAGNVPTLNSIEVGTNVVKSDRAYDLGLITRFDDLAAMEAYQVHPFHQDVLAYLKTVVKTAVSIDYES